MTETRIRTAALMQAERMLRDQTRTANKRNNAQTTTPAEDNSTNANKRECPEKKANQATKTEQRAKKDIQIAKLSITSGKVEDITDGDEH
ncbi:hypothetical protein SARC_08836 [Sphaeroforma arctica JP610]|uniref:Uncharacterized protein n=1 Tax=Sphaeroforma arctica JP610 TaxID=667725 RepID=A0A0L0FQC7_9EUKA|nr:hypothetical protein SARC_08836 [Sphaeroforma arctica JP610]KNC78741.1 hypothetical protein SARC_08836 [Sphaeroforma arctica JP610]|eukprot:XP_014152643.1 hypothetical protein SARC_08836 [Sphaeroforma arctica JP610]